MVMPTYEHSRAGLAGLAGRMRPAGRQLDNSDVDYWAHAIWVILKSTISAYSAIDRYRRHSRHSTDGATNAKKLQSSHLNN